MDGYDLIALDMDGTLLTSDKRVLAETARDIDAAAAAGKTLAFCTGRCVPEMVQYAEPFRAIRYAVSMSGAVITDLFENRSLYAVGIGRDLVLDILAMLAPYDVMVHFLTEEASYVRGDQAYRIADYHMGAYFHLFTQIARHTDDMAAVAARLDYVPKINLYFRYMDDCRAVRGQMEARGLPLTITYTEGPGLELSPPGASKGESLRRLADLLHIPMERVVAVGDGDNDVSMLRAAGLGVAMGNAAPAVKAAADAVVADNDHNGAGEAIRRFML